MLKRSLIASAVTLTISAGHAHAASPFATIYSFGDSLSDVGNTYLATGGTRPANPYVDGQYSNGPIWVQDLAAGLGLPALTPSLAGGDDYAWGGATTGYSLTINPAVPVPPLTTQISTFLGLHSDIAPPDALYTFSIGANDLFGILGAGLTGSAAAALASGAAQVEADAAGELKAKGATDLVLFGVPDLGLTPSIEAANALRPGLAAEATTLSQQFDWFLLQDLATDAPGLVIHYVDSFALIQNEVNDPKAYGFTDVSDPCWTGGFTGFAGPGSECGSPGTYLFWDSVHPTALGHQLIADAARAAIPEPSTWAMMLAGFAGVGFIGWRRARASHPSLAA
jgi:phospholipase/lecithinase/hemolysin